MLYVRNTGIERSSCGIINGLLVIKNNHLHVQIEVLMIKELVEFL